MSTEAITESASLHVPDFPGDFRHAASSESTRYAIAGVEIRQTDDDSGVWLSATDGRILAVRKTEGHVNGPPVVVPLELIRRQRESLQRNGTELIRNGKGVSADPVEGNFPPVSDVIPEVAEDVRVLTLSGKLLWNLARAVADKDEDYAITMMVPVTGKKPEAKPVAVLGKHGFGVLMPRTADEKTVANYNAARSDYRAAAIGGAR